MEGETKHRNLLFFILRNLTELWVLFDGVAGLKRFPIGGDAQLRWWWVSKYELKIIQPMDYSDYETLGKQVPFRSSFPTQSFNLRHPVAQDIEVCRFWYWIPQFHRDLVLAFGGFSMSKVLSLEFHESRAQDRTNSSDSWTCLYLFRLTDDVIIPIQPLRSIKMILVYYDMIMLYM